MSAISPKILVIADSADAEEISTLLREADFRDVAIGDGGDETLDLFEQGKPDVVLLASRLRVGDARALAEAIGSGGYGRPAPVLVVDSSDPRAKHEDSGELPSSNSLTRPLSKEALAMAVRQSTKAAAGERIGAAMDLAIENYVADALGALSVSGPPAVKTTTGEVVSAWDGGPEETTGQPWREPTFVLSDEEGAPNADELAGGLDDESQRLLEEVLPGSPDEHGNSGESAVDTDGDTDTSQVAPPSGGDFARELRRKMSAMAERLFPGQQPDADPRVERPAAAHTEIDLGEFNVEPNVQESSEINSAISDEYVTTDARTDDLTIDGATRTDRRTRSREAGQGFVGELNGHDNDIAAVLSRFLRSAFSGTLVIRNGELEKRLQFDEGRVVFASSSTSDDRMSDLLMREGKINAEQLQHCRDLVARTGRRMGEVLVDQGFLKPRELLPAVRHHLEDLFYSTLAWTVGTFDALPGQTLDERIRLSRHPAALILEGVRRKYDLERLEACLGGGGTVVLATPGEALNAVIGATDLSAEELRAQALFDGEHSLDDIARLCQQSPRRIAQLAYAWVCLGAAEIVERGADEERPSVASTHFVGETDLEIDRQRVFAKYSLVKEADYFQLLGVRVDASAFEIRRAFEAVRRYFSPDSFPPELQDELRNELEDIVEVIDEAYRVLANDMLRTSYRANLH